MRLPAHRLYILSGLAGSGRTAWVRRLLEKPDFKKGSPTVPIFLASSGVAESRTASGVEYVYPIQHQLDRVWGEVMDFMMQANQGQGVFYALSSEELRDHLDHRQAFMDVRFHADRIEWCTTSGLCLGTYSISEKR